MNTNITTPRVPSGFNEYLPAYQIEFNRLLGIITSTYEKYGFAPIDAPILELSEVLLAKGGGETEQQVYRFERGRNDLTMRYDLTVPLARYVAQHQSDIAFPFRRYQIGKVYRAERAQSGRFREFYQCDIDIIGNELPIADAELPAIINDIFAQFNCGEFVIRINNRRLLNGFLADLGLSERAPEVLRAIDKVEKLTDEEFKIELERAGCSVVQTKRLIEFITITGLNDNILTELASLDIENDDFTAGLATLRSVMAALRAMKVPTHRYQIDLKIARGLDYYTGTVYETNLIDHPRIGSVCSGGRYDDLASNYTKTRLSGVGVSIGLTRLFYQLCEAGIIAPKTHSAANIMVMPLSCAEVPYALEIAAQLRRTQPVIMHKDDAPLGKKLKYADRMGVRFVLLAGEQELQDQHVTLKDMQTGESQTGPLEVIEAVINSSD